jgi:activator of 2-hydroxyglutaryl-CoA dehydratase
MFLDTSIQGSENRTVTVYGYNHAFGVWMPLAETGVAGTAITVIANDTQTHKIVDIAGTDRVYFRINTGLHANNKFFAACSSF